MVDGKTQNIQGFLSDSPGIILEHTPPDGYGLGVNNLFTKATCPTVSENIITQEGAYFG